MTLLRCTFDCQRCRWTKIQCYNPDTEPMPTLCRACEMKMVCRIPNEVRYGLNPAYSAESPPAPPPTTEWLGRPTYQAPMMLEPGHRVLTLAGCIALGFLLGYLAGS